MGRTCKYFAVRFEALFCKYDVIYVEPGFRVRLPLNIASL